MSHPRIIWNVIGFAVVEALLIVNADPLALIATVNEVHDTPLVLTYILLLTNLPLSIYWMVEPIDLQWMHERNMLSTQYKRIIAI